MAALYIGLISGTSLDAINAVLADFSTPKPSIIATYKHPLPQALQEEILALCIPGINEINRLGVLDVKLGHLFASCVHSLLDNNNVLSDEIIAIGSHGQTIRHDPYGKYPFTMQIADPNIIADKTGITTIADFRRRDIANNGQGAPLAPAFHAAMFRTPLQNKIILNLGGIANITWLSKNYNDPILGFDTGPANTLLDAYCQKHLQTTFDNKGAWAKTGVILPELLASLLADPYFKITTPKSTGREYFNLTWLENFISAEYASTKPENIQATLCELTAISISQAISSITQTPCEVLVCGGGINNLYLMERIKHHSEYSVFSSEKYGIDPDWVEAMAFAWLAQQTLNKKPGNLPSVTGSNAFTILGGIYHGKLPTFVNC